LAHRFLHIVHPLFLQLLRKRRCANVIVRCSEHFPFANFPWKAGMRTTGAAHPYPHLLDKLHLVSHNMLLASPSVTPGHLHCIFTLRLRAHQPVKYSRSSTAVPGQTPQLPAGKQGTPLDDYLNGRYPRLSFSSGTAIRN
jgi:hypothetical protein